MKNKVKLCRQINGGKSKSYLAAAAWIANFGVVPLFLLAAFLLVPAFFFFLNLLLVVTHVLETIRPLLFSYYNQLHINCRRHNCNKFNSVQYSDFKPSFVPIFQPCVKGLMVFLVNIVLLCASSLPALAGSDHILARGESFALPLPSMKKFNVGNKEVITYRFDEKKRVLLMRGARQGHTEILVWNDNNALPEKHQVFVISKIQEAKFLHLAELLSSLGLETKLHLPHLKVTGELNSLGQYLQYKQIEAANPTVILDGATLAASLKKSIIAEIYQLFFNDYKESIQCHVEHTEISCAYPANEAPSESMKQQLITKFKISFIELNNQRFKKNYSFKLRLIQLEQLDGEELRLGLEQLSASLGDLLKLPLQTIVEKNAFLLSQKKVRMNTLAEPQGLLRPMAPAEFQIGADVPYVSSNPNGTIAQTQWQFAGLKVRLTIENFGEKIKVNYESELTRPSISTNGRQTSISGNKEKSSIVIDLQRPTQIFQISLKTDAENIDQMPFLNRIPLLGELFKSKSSQNNYKMITGLLEVTEHE